VELGDFLIKFVPPFLLAIVALGSLRIAWRRVFPDVRATKVDTESKVLGMYAAAVDQVEERDATNLKMRVQLDKQSDDYDAVREELKQMRRDFNQQARIVELLEKTIEAERRETTSYKSQYEAMRADLTECRKSCQATAAIVRIMRAVMKDGGLLTDALERDIEQVLASAAPVASLPVDPNALHVGDTVTLAPAPEKPDSDLPPDAYLP
jgi:hypothetical protein